MSQRHVNADGSFYEGESSFRPRQQLSLVARTFPVSTSLPGYLKRNGRHDLIAGVTVAALAIPSAMAYAELAGLSPVAGLYALLLPAVAYAFLGSSRQVVVGPEGALSLLVAVSVAPLAAGNPSTYAALAAMLGLLVGAIAVVGRVIRLGWVADYFSRSMLVGYVHGVAVVLVCGQLGKLFGGPIAAEDPLPQLKEFFSELDQIHGLTVLVGALSIGVLLLLKWKMPKIPAALLVVVAGIAASAASGVKALLQIIDALTKDQIALVVARLKSHQMERFETTGLATRIGRDRFFPTVVDAVDWCVGEQTGPEGGTA